MNCPVCDGARLREVEKDGILIDVCPSCKGVWLDRGELEKLMEGVREVRQSYNEWYYGDSASRQHGSRPDQAPPKSPPPREYQQQPYYGSHPQGHPKYRKKKSVLDVFGDLFD